MNYFEMVIDALGTINKDKLAEFLEVISRQDEAQNQSPAIFFGNGGSAAIANHIVADLSKGIFEDNSGWCYPCISLCSNSPLMTAISNDIGYDKLFSRQLEYLAFKKADVIAISSSGNSANVIEGLISAKKIGYKTFALVGFDGGRVLKENLADIIIHINSNNYGVVEDCHMMILHMLTQEIRKFLSPDPSSLKL